MTNARKIWLTRHGESEYNQKALIGGDSPLSANGQAYSEMLPDVILNRLPKVWGRGWVGALHQTQQKEQAMQAEGCARASFGHGNMSSSGCCTHCVGRVRCIGHSSRSRSSRWKGRHTLSLCTAMRESSSSSSGCSVHCVGSRVHCPIMLCPIIPLPGP